MAAQVVAARAAQALAAAAPDIRDYVMKKLSAATGNSVSSGKSIVPFVGSDAARAKVVVTNLAAAGIDPKTVFDGVKLSDPVLVAARSQAMQVFAQLEQQVVDHFTTTDRDSVVQAAILTRATNRRVEAALRIFGSEENYYLVQGLAPAHFAAYAASKR